MQRHRSDGPGEYERLGSDRFRVSGLSHSTYLVRVWHDSVTLQTQSALRDDVLLLMLTQCCCGLQLVELEGHRRIRRLGQEIAYGLRGAASHAGADDNSSLAVNQGLGVSELDFGAAMV
jgi:hypothetical protein